MKLALADVALIVVGFVGCAVLAPSWFELAKWVVLTAQIPLTLAIWKGKQ